MRGVDGFALAGRVVYEADTLRSANVDAFRQMFVCLIKAAVASSRPGTFWAVARKSGQIRRIAAGPEPRAAPLEGEHDEDSQFDRAEHTPCCGKAGGGLVTVAWSHFEHIKRRKRWLRTRCGIDRSQRCLEALDEALARHGRPEIFNTDQGSQFTSAALTGLLLGNAIRISMGMAAARRATTCSSNGYGGRSNTKRSTYVPMTEWLRRAARSAVIWPSTTARGRTRA